MELAN